MNWLQMHNTTISILGDAVQNKAGSDERERWHGVNNHNIYIVNSILG